MSPTLTTIRQRESDMEVKTGNLLDNLTRTNREFVDRHIEKLRGELVELDKAEALALELQNRDHRVEAFTREAIGVVRDFRRLAAEGTVEEKRTLIRAFLRVLDFDPVTRKGVAHFWVVPSVGQDEFVVGPLSERAAMRNPDQVRSSADARRQATGNDAQTANRDAEVSQDAQGRSTHELDRTEATPYAKQKTCPRKGMSHEDLVAGARTDRKEMTRPWRWRLELPFYALRRVVDAFWEDAKVRLVKAEPKRKPRKVAGM